MKISRYKAIFDEFLSKVIVCITIKQLHIMELKNILRSIQGTQSLSIKSCNVTVREMKLFKKREKEKKFGVKTQKSDFKRINT